RRSGRSMPAPAVGSPVPPAPGPADPPPPPWSPDASGSAVRPWLESSPSALFDQVATSSLRRIAAMTGLPEQAKQLLDDANFVVVATSNTDGSPQTSVLWATYDGDDLLMSTVQGRKKETNWLNDPRASVLILDKDDPYS